MVQHILTLFYKLEKNDRMYSLYDPRTLCHDAYIFIYKINIAHNLIQIILILLIVLLSR